MAEYKQLKDLPVWNRALGLAELARDTITPLRAHVVEVRDRLVEARDKLQASKEADMRPSVGLEKGSILNTPKAPAEGSEAV